MKEEQGTLPVRARAKWSRDSGGAVWRAQLSSSVVSNSLQPHGLQHTRLPCPSPIPRVYSHSCPLHQWCHPTILSSVIPFSPCLQSFPASGSFPVSQFFTSGGLSIEVSASASVLSVNILDWFPLGSTKIRLMHQHKMEVVKHEVARLNMDILGISALKWTGMGEFNSDDHYIYYCGQESLWRNGVALIGNKRAWNAVPVCNLKNNKMISVHFQSKPSISQLSGLCTNH